MSHEHTLTFEEVNKHFEQADLSEFKEGGHGFSAVAAQAVSPADALSAACRAYRVIRPFLNLVLGIPFVPAGWKNAIRTFVNFMNGICP